SRAFLSPLAGEGGAGSPSEAAPGEGVKPKRPRDYYRIEDEDGHRYWVFREGLYQESTQGSPGWFMHGVFG
ncbi:MAG: hypothetical protein ACM3MH_05495, partial [Actinomycetota bacterium]